MSLILFILITFYTITGLVAGTIVYEENEHLWNLRQKLFVVIISGPAVWIIFTMQALFKVVFDNIRYFLCKILHKLADKD